MWHKLKETLFMKRALLAGLASLMLALSACTVGPQPTQVSMNQILTAVAATIAAKKTQGTPMQGTPLTDQGTPVPPASQRPLPTALPTLTLSPTPTGTPTGTPTVTPTVGGVTQGLLVYYPLDEPKAAGEKVKDQSPQGNDAAVSGQPRFVAQGRLGGAFSFGGSDYLKLSHNPTAGLASFSVSLWLKTDEPGQDYKLANAATWQNSQGSGWVVGTRLSEAWSADHASLLAQQCDRTFALVPKVWNHLVVTYDRTRFREYVNGRLSSECAGTGQAPGVGQALEVGGWSPLYPFNYVGLLDEFRLYGRALTPAEVAQLYAPEVLANLDDRRLVYFSFDQASGNVIKNETVAGATPGAGGPLIGATPAATATAGAAADATNYDGTVTGTPGFAPLGRIGGAYEFSNSNLVTLARNPTAGLSAFAATLWFKTDQPELDRKLASAASFRGGVVTGWTLGTKFSEFFSDDGKPIIVGECYRSSAPRPGEWNHLAVSYNGSRLQEYLNGDLAMDCDTTHRPLGQGRPLEVGGWSSLPGFDYTGLLDEFRVYGRALSPAEVVVIMATGHP
jgi:hypothetical protein